MKLKDLLKMTFVKKGKRLFFEKIVTYMIVAFILLVFMQPKYIEYLYELYMKSAAFSGISMGQVYTKLILTVLPLIIGIILLFTIAYMLFQVDVNVEEPKKVINKEHLVEKKIADKKVEPVKKEATRKTAVKKTEPVKKAVVKKTTTKKSDAGTKRKTNVKKDSK